MTDVNGQRVVVTGAGRGIGAALAQRFAAEGARVGVNDRHPERAAEVAARIGGVPIPGDAATLSLDEARHALGGDIDVYCANAGVVHDGGPELADEQWQAAWDHNVLAHIRAARQLLPGWLARGRGRFVSTVSAAGLLTMVGAAPYAVSKHAALAFAEWLAVTYRHHGIRVHAICPRGVLTPLHQALDNATAVPLTSTAIGPEQVADSLFAGMAEDRFLILPHPEVADHARARLADHERWLADINALHRRKAGTTAADPVANQHASP
ncbi:SDR family NAD(P)-dependent oxidoreductase [Streptomyces marincola]|uniref:SDR family NAD(P)-dependent oxidoreductase n=1 Tax=Streptomyces marincola TaxID=2878388 RepID=UPI001CF50549|nr:SDR family oxidoreductase [Streptomyces marincola]UCM87064.1 SDR family oxidoreductase [Streptomyces marincola]